MGFQDKLLLNAGQKYRRMLPLEHSAILLTCIELLHGFKTFVCSIFEWPLKTGFTEVERQTVWIQIRLLLWEQSDWDLHCLIKASETFQNTTKADDFCCDWRSKE